MRENVINKQKKGKEGRYVLEKGSCERGGCEGGKVGGGGGERGWDGTEQGRKGVTDEWKGSRMEQYGEGGLDQG